MRGFSGALPSPPGARAPRVLQLEQVLAPPPDEPGALAGRPALAAQQEPDEPGALVARQELAAQQEPDEPGALVARQEPGVPPVVGPVAAPEQPGAIEERLGLAEIAWLPVQRGEARQQACSVRDADFALDSEPVDSVQAALRPGPARSVSHSVRLGGIVQAWTARVPARSAPGASIVPPPKGAQPGRGKKSEAVELARQVPDVPDSPMQIVRDSKLPFVPARLVPQPARCAFHEASRVPRGSAARSFRPVRRCS